MTKYSYLFVLISLVFATSKECGNVLPGMSFLLVGIDRSSYDPKSSQNTYLQPVLMFDCNGNNTYYDSYTNITYDVPDQINSITQVGGLNTDIKTFITDNTFDLETQINTYESKNSNYTIGSFAMSESVKLSFDTFYNQYRAVGASYSSIYANQIELISSDQLTFSGPLQNFVYENLTPPPYFNNGSVNTYNILFQTFGTD